MQMDNKIEISFGLITEQDFTEIDIQSVQDTPKQQ